MCAQNSQASCGSSFSPPYFQLQRRETTTVRLTLEDIKVRRSGYPFCSAVSTDFLACLRAALDFVASLAKENRCDRSRSRPPDLSAAPVSGRAAPEAR